MKHFSLTDTPPLPSQIHTHQTGSRTGNSNYFGSAMERHADSSNATSHCDLTNPRLSLVSMGDGTSIKALLDFTFTITVLERVMSRHAISQTWAKSLCSAYKLSHSTLGRNGEEVTTTISSTIIIVIAFGNRSWPHFRHHLSICLER